MSKSQKPRKPYKPATKGTNQPSSEAGNNLKYLSQEFSGPMPPPALLEHYENIQPGFTAHLMEENTAERKHRQKMEEKVTTNSNRSALLGIIAALLVVSGFIWLVYYALSTGNGQYVGSIVGYPMVALVLGFITRKYFQNKDKK